MHSRDRIQLVHAHFILPQGLFGLIISRILRTPLVVTTTGTDINVIFNSSWLYQRLSLFVLKNAQTVIGVSKPICAHLSQVGLSNVVYIPNSVDVDSIPPANLGNKTILFVGTLNGNKRPLFLLRAFAQVIRRLPEAKLYIVGEGSLRLAVQEEIKSRNLQNSVNMIPHLDPNNLNKLRSLTSVFVQPSLFEGMSLAILETLASGQLVIATRNESNSSFLDNGRTALLFEENDCGQLSDLIVLAFSNEALRYRISKSGRNLVRRYFSNNVVAGKLERVYHSLTR